MHSLNITHCAKRGVKHKVHEVQRKQSDSHKVHVQMSTTGMNTSTQAYWPLVNCVTNQRLLQASPPMQQTQSQLINDMNVTVTSYLRHMHKNV